MKPEEYAGETEHSQQVALFMWIADNFHLNSDLKMIFAIPNGGLRNKATAGRLKAEGTRAGVPDIFCAVPRMKGGHWFHGLFVEMKRPKGGVTSPEQSDWHVRLTGLGYRCVVCNNWIDARNEILWYLASQPVLTNY